LSERVALPLDDFGSSSCAVPALCASGSLSAVFPFSGAERGSVEVLSRLDIISMLSLVSLASGFWLTVFAIRNYGVFASDQSGSKVACPFAK
jgi:hypothetical protein